MSWLTSFLGAPTEAPTHVPSPDQERELVLYGRRSCPYCVRVYRELERLELTVELRDTSGGSSHRQVLIQQTGRSQVPCLFIDGEALFESADIVAWLRAYKARSTES